MSSRCHALSFLRVRSTLGALFAVLIVLSAPRIALAVTDSINTPLGFFPLPAPVEVLAQRDIPALQNADFDLKSAPHTTSVSAAILQIEVLGAGTTVAGQARVFNPDGVAPAPGGNFEYNASTDAIHLVTAAVSTGGKIRIANQAWGGTLRVRAHLVGYFATQAFDAWGLQYFGGYRGSKARTVHTGRDANGSFIARGSGAAFDVKVAGIAGVPLNAPRVALRVTTLPLNAVNALRDVQVSSSAENAYPYSTAWSFNESVPLSHVATLAPNPSTGMVRVELPASAKNAGVSTAVMVDVLGYLDGTTFRPIGPGPSRTLATLTAGTTKTPDIRGMDGIPARTDCPGFGLWPNNGNECVLAVVLNARVTGVTLPAGVSQAKISIGGIPQLLARPNQQTTNQLVLPLTRGLPAAGGKLPAISIDRGSATIQYDVVGWYEHARYDAGDLGSNTSARYRPVTPARMYSSEGWGAPLETAIDIDLSGQIPAYGVSQVVLSVDVFTATKPVSVTLYPRGGTRPPTPQLRANSQRDSNLVVVDVSRDRKVTAIVSENSGYFSVSVEGYYTPYAGRDAPEPGETPDPILGKTLAIIGDSITEGGSRDYQRLLASKLRTNVFGISGYTSWQMRWWAGLLAPSKPEFVVVNLGTNDSVIWSRQTTENTQLLSSFSNSCKYVVTINTQKIPGTGDEWNYHFQNAIAINATFKNTVAGPSSTVGWIDWAQYVIDNQINGARLALMSTDSLHPTALGREHLSDLYRRAVARPTNDKYIKACTVPPAG